MLLECVCLVASLSSFSSLYLVSYRNSLRYLWRGFGASLHRTAYIFKQYCSDIASCAYTRISRFPTPLMPFYSTIRSLLQYLHYTSPQRARENIPLHMLYLWKPLLSFLLSLSSHLFFFSFDLFLKVVTASAIDELAPTPRGTWIFRSHFFSSYFFSLCSFAIAASLHRRTHRIGRYWVLVFSTHSFCPRCLSLVRTLFHWRIIPTWITHDTFTFAGIKVISIKFQIWKSSAPLQVIERFAIVFTAQKISHQQIISMVGAWQSDDLSNNGNWIWKWRNEWNDCEKKKKHVNFVDI